MKNLPLEIHIKILDYLDLNDLFNYRSTSKQLKNVVKNYSIKELIFNNGMQKFNWFYTNQLVNFGYCINKSKLSFLNSRSFNFKNLKSLYIECDELDLNLLNKFSNLENLEIYFNKIKGLNIELKLINLKSLDINEIDSPIILNTPNLIAIRIFNPNTYNKITFSYPLKIKIVHLFELNTRILFQFKNIEILKLLDRSCYIMLLNVNYYPNYFNLPNQIDDNFLKNLPSLKFINLTTINGAKKIFIQKKQLNKSDLMISCKGLPINEESDLNTSYCYNALSNLDLLNCSVPYKILNYNLFKNQLPKIGTKFLNDKFDLIRHINIYGHTDENHLVFIIKNCRNLEKLSIIDSGLTNQFYDQLNSFTLFSIDINEFNLELDFKFISNMLYLKNLKTNLDFNLDKSFKLDRLVYLEKIEFNFNSNIITINKLKNNQYSIETLKKLSIPDKKFRFNELINWINHIKLKKNKIMIIDRTKRKRKVKDPVFSLWKKRTI